MARFEGLPGTDDKFELTPDTDTVVIAKGGGHDTIHNFVEDQDTLDLVLPKPFHNLDDLDWSQSGDGSVVLDLSQVDGADPGTDTVTFRDFTGSIDENDLWFTEWVPPEPGSEQPVTDYPNPDPMPVTHDAAGPKPNVIPVPPPDPGVPGKIGLMNPPSTNLIWTTEKPNPDLNLIGDSVSAPVDEPSRGGSFGDSFPMEPSPPQRSGDGTSFAEAFWQ